MLADIEDRIGARLNQKIAEPKRVRIDEAHTSLAVPDIDVVIGGGSFAKVAQEYELKPSVYVIVTFQNMRSVRDRRHGVYPILEAIIGALVLQKLDLAIGALVPIRMDPITTEAEAKEGKVVYQLEFQTSMGFARMSDEQVADLLQIGLNYYLKPGDDTADASDLLTLNAT